LFDQFRVTLNSGAVECLTVCDYWATPQHLDTSTPQRDKFDDNPFKGGTCRQMGGM